MHIYIFDKGYFFPTPCSFKTNYGMLIMESLYYVIAVKTFHTITLREDVASVTISLFQKKFLQEFIQPEQQNDSTKA